VVETQHSPLGLRPLSAARHLGAQAVFVTRDLRRYVHDGSPLTALPDLADEVIEADTTDPAVIAGLLRPGDGVCTVTDYSLEVVAEAADLAGLPGLDPAAARAARNKLATREACVRAGVPVPRFAWALTVSQAQEAAAAIGYPCVVKPLTDAGSIGVALCRNSEALEQAARQLLAVVTDYRGQPRPAGILVEEYLVGPEVSVESVVADGRRSVLGVTDKKLGPHPYFAELGQDFPSLLPTAAQRACTEAATAALDAIGHDFGAAHVEVKLTAAGPFLVEVNARPAGALITALIEESTGIDLVLQVARLHLGQRADLTVTRHCGAASRHLAAPADGVVRAVHGLDLARMVPGTSEVAVYVSPGDRVRVPRNNADTLGHVVAVGETAGAAARSADTAIGQLSVEVAS
jgi:S-sulfo-L-cysteine synthase (3-phospho-L-serine-dependent)